MPLFHNSLCKSAYRTKTCSRGLPGTGNEWLQFNNSDRQRGNIAPCYIPRSLSARLPQDQVNCCAGAVVVMVVVVAAVVVELAAVVLWAGRLPAKQFSVSSILTGVSLMLALMLSLPAARWVQELTRRIPCTASEDDSVDVVAQSVGHQVVNLAVAGSSPVHGIRLVNS